ncbi:lipid II flippase MurJ [Actinoplanes sp. NBRC 103695]|uniref:lipopolysaccharide biosynthesis protein n=1 Tax=Actinoplanes sp. NBRC 103695 TaxID=3032202 RepID=UPI002555B7DD|nr:lipid II flippase MurJ [Actinoplanes sp. NBRC 103695]
MTVALLPGAALAILVAAAGTAAATPIAHALNVNDPTLLRLAFGGVPLIVAATILLAAVRATRPIHVYAGIQFVLVPILRPLLLLLAGGSLLLGLTSWLLPITAALLIAFALAPRPGRHPAGWRPFWSYALPRAVSVAVDASSMWIGVLLTGALAGQTEAGLFAAAGRYALAGLLIMQGLRVAMAPQLSKLLGDDRRDEAATLYRRTTLTIVALSFPAYLMLGIFAPAFLSLFGPEFAEAAAPLAVLCVAMLVNVGVGLVQTVLLMSGRSRGHLYATLLGLALNVVACPLLIPRWGALGAAFAWSLGIVAENLLAARLARRALRRPLSSRPLWLTAAGATAVTVLAAAAGVATGGRNLPGLAVALAVFLPIGLAAAVRSRKKGRQ